MLCYVMLCYVCMLCMYVCMHVCMYVCICMHMYTYVYICMHMYTYVYIYIYIERERANNHHNKHDDNSTSKSNLPCEDARGRQGEQAEHALRQGILIV